MKTLILLLFLLIISSCNKKSSCSESDSSSNSDSSSSNCTSPDVTPLPTQPLEPDVGENDPSDTTQTTPAPDDSSEEVPEVPETPEVPTEEAPSDSSSSLPNEAFLFDATVKFTNFGADDEDKVYKAIEIIKNVIRSEEFRERVVNFTYQGKKQFVDSKGLSNEEIYLKLLNGKEDLLPEIDHEMDLDLQLYYSWRSTVGYTYPNTMRIWMNTKFFNYYTPTEVAGNIFHEWTHKLGFDHATYYSTSRDSSVPYALGYLIEELGKKFE